MRTAVVLLSALTIWVGFLVIPWVHDATYSDSNRELLIGSRQAIFYSVVVGIALITVAVLLGTRIVPRIDAKLRNAGFAIRRAIQPNLSANEAEELVRRYIKRMRGVSIVTYHGAVSVNRLPSCELENWSYYSVLAYSYWLTRYLHVRYSLHNAERMRSALADILEQWDPDSSKELTHLHSRVERAIKSKEDELDRSLIASRAVSSWFTSRLFVGCEVNAAVEIGLGYHFFDTANQYDFSDEPFEPSESHHSFA